MMRLDLVLRKRIADNPQLQKGRSNTKHGSAMMEPHMKRGFGLIQHIMCSTRAVHFYCLSEVNLSTVTSIQHSFQLASSRLGMNRRCKAQHSRASPPLAFLSRQIRKWKIKVRLSINSLLPHKYFLFSDISILHLFRSFYSFTQVEHLVHCQQKYLVVRQIVYFFRKDQRFHER